jgi:glutathione S-transferase
MLKIWGRTNSTNVKKVLWIAEELGLAYERVDAGGAFGVVNDPAYRAMNPNGLVPVIEDDGFILWESNTIVRYLSAKYGADGFGPTDLAGEASAEKWMDWTPATLGVGFRDVFWNMVRTEPVKRDMAAVERGIITVAKGLAIANAALEKKPYLSGDVCGLGDIPLGVIAYGWFEMDIERPSMPALEAWYDRLKERPAYQKAVMIPLS